MNDPLRHMLATAGPKAAREAFERSYRSLSRFKILGGMPPPKDTEARMMSARWAMIDTGQQDRMWAIGREIDAEYIREVM